MKRITALVLSGLMLTLLAGVGCKEKKEKQKEQEIKTELKQQARKDTRKKNVALFKIDDKVFSVPSPFQVSYLVKKMNIEYTPEYLNSTNHLSRYQTDFKKAVNLGIYGANLGYLNIYEQYPKAARYVAAVKELANQLGITNSFDKETIDRIERNSTNKDSLIHIVSRIYRDADAYLMNNKQKDIAIFVLAGGWIESLYFLSQTAVKTPKKEVINRIAEQKYPLDNLLNLLRPYYQERTEAVDEFILALTGLSSVFGNINIKYEYKEPKVYPNKKLTVVKSESMAQISDKQLQKIATKTKKIRKKLVE